MSIDIIDLLEVVHVKESKTSVCFLHGARNQLFSETSRRKPRQQIIASGFFLLLQRNDNIRYKLIDCALTVHRQIVCGILRRLLRYQSTVLQKAKACFRRLRIKLASCISPDFILNRLRRKRVPVNTPRIHRIKAVRYGHNSCISRDFLPRQTIRIPRSVITLMMTSCHLLQMRNHRNVLQNVDSHNGVAFHQIVFCLCKLSGLVQNILRNSDFSDVMQIRTVLQIPDFLRRPAQLRCNLRRILCHSLRMTAAVFILGFNRCRQGLHHSERHCFILLLLLLKLLLLSFRFHMLDSTNRPNGIHEQQKDHSGADKKP